MNRLDRLAAILVQLQAKRTVRGQALAEQFGVSLRTVYRDLRSLEEAGVPLCGEAGVGYSLAEGYRLPPVMFSREEAAALLTAEKLAAKLTDARTAQLNAAAMDKLRAVLRRTDRDYLETLSPHIEILRPPALRGAPAAEAAHQQLLEAVAEHRVVTLRYRANYSGHTSVRDVEPIGLYFGQFWHLVAFCRLRQALRDFRLYRIADLQLRADHFAPRPETLQRYREQLAADRAPRHTAVVRFAAAALPQVNDAKHYYGWVHETPAPDGAAEMTLRAGCLAFLARWLLAFAGQVEVLSPPELQLELRTLAQAAAAHFG